MLRTRPAGINGIKAGCAVWFPLVAGHCRGCVKQATKPMVYAPIVKFHRPLPDGVAGRAAAQPGKFIWTTGLAKLHLSGHPKTVDDLAISWIDVGSAGPQFDAVTLGDGSGLHTCIAETRRCGWGLCSALDSD